MLNASYVPSTVFVPLSIILTFTLTEASDHSLFKTRKPRLSQEKYLAQGQAAGQRQSKDRKLAPPDSVALRFLLCHFNEKTHLHRLMYTEKCYTMKSAAFFPILIVGFFFSIRIVNKCET